MFVRTLIACTVMAATTLFSMPLSAQLTPPAGPVTDSFKSLDEVEPRIPLSQETTPGDAFNEFIVTQPGSYYLTGSIATAKTTALRIDTTGDVTIDLNGFTLTHIPAVSSAILIGNAVGACTIRGGNIEGGGSGISATAPVLTAGASLLVEGVSIQNLGNVGVFSPRITTIRISAIRNTGAQGIFLSGATSNGSVIERTQVFSAGSTAILVTESARITDVTIIDSSAGALFTGVGANIRGLTVTDFGTAGFTTTGVTIGENSMISHSVFNTYRGIGSAVFLGRNTTGSTLTVSGAPTGTGIAMGTSATLLDSFVDNTRVEGVKAVSYATIKRCAIELSAGGVAIEIERNCVVDGNRFFGDVRITSIRNVVTRNTLDSGTIFNLGGGTNTIGPINDLTSPWANFVK